jgi:ADP-dependent phosphofructokinase/glucokinase
VATKCEKAKDKIKKISVKNNVRMMICDAIDEIRVETQDELRVVVDEIAENNKNEITSNFEKLLQNYKNESDKKTEDLQIEFDKKTEDLQFNLKVFKVN